MVGLDNIVAAYISFNINKSNMSFSCDLRTHVKRTATIETLECILCSEENKFCTVAQKT